jgi:hypothetical protein
VQQQLHRGQNQHPQPDTQAAAQRQENFLFRIRCLTNARWAMDDPLKTIDAYLPETTADRDCVRDSEHLAHTTAHRDF